MNLDLCTVSPDVCIVAVHVCIHGVLKVGCSDGLVEGCSGDYPEVICSSEMVGTSQSHQYISKLNIFMKLFLRMFFKQDFLFANREISK